MAAAVVTLLVSGCGTTSRPLPKYEPPLARTTFQTVRTTAYTHTESDHVEYGNHNALGGTLRAAGPPVAPAPPVALPVEPAAPPALAARDGTGYGAGGFHRVSNPMSMAANVPPPTPIPAPVEAPGSAAADWSRWPAGTVFRILPTGQLYKVDDYGWALSGRNTIDLYLPTRATMNDWGVREVPIQIVQWGDRDESLRLLSRHQKYRHIRRMVLELEGKRRAAASMR